MAQMSFICACTRPVLVRQLRMSTWQASGSGWRAERFGVHGLERSWSERVRGCVGAVLRCAGY